MQAIEDACADGVTLQAVQQYTPHKDDSEARRIANIADAAERADAINAWVQPAGPPRVAWFA